MIIGQLNVSSIKHKFEMLTLQIQENIGILIIFEAKLYNTFPTGKFLINALKQLFAFIKTDTVVRAFSTLGKIYHEIYCL